MLRAALWIFLTTFMTAQAEVRLPGYRVAIIDRFFPPAAGFENEQERVSSGWMYGLLDIDDDEKKEPLYHGDMVRLIASHPQITFLTYPIQPGSNPMGEILSNLRNIHDRYPKQPVDAVLLSWESSTLISEFEKPLRLEHATQYKNKVREMGRNDPVWQTTYDIIILLEKLAGKGVAVYTISGNGGRGMVNTFSFAEGVITVGASEVELGHYIANNPFVDTYARAAYEVVRVDDAKGQPLGYDVNGDHCVDIPLEKLTGFQSEKPDYPVKFWKLLTGSSFAAPAALKIALFENLPLQTCKAGI